MKSKVKKTALKYIVLLVLLINNIAYAQYPIKVTVAVTPPYPTYLSDYVNEAGKTLLILQNTDFTNSYKVKFGATIEGDNGIVIQLKPSIEPTDPLLLEPGEVRTVTGDELSSMYSNISFEDLIYSGPSVDKVIQSQKIPEGNYVGCVVVFDAFTNAQLSEDPPLGCSPTFGILALDPPVITSPQDESILIQQDVQQLIFSWTNVAGAQLPISYNWRLVTLPNGVNPYDAIESDNLLVWEEKDLLAPVFLYGPQFPPLAVGEQFAVRVQAFDPTGGTLISNDGFSEIVTFTHAAPFFFPVDTTPTIVNIPIDSIPIFTPNDDDGNPLVGEVFNCGDDCADININNTNDFNAVARGMEVKMGHFIMELSQFQKFGNKYTGTGLILGTEFCKLPVRVDFVNIKINSKREVYSGSAKAKKNQSWFGFDVFDENAEFNHFNNAQNVVELHSKLMTVGQGISTYVGDVLAPEYELGATLPLGFGDEESPSIYSIHIVDMRFTPQNATIAVMHVAELPGFINLDNKEQYLALGNTNICYTPGGPASGEDNTKLDLLKELECGTSENYSFHLLKSDNNDEGTYGNYNCDGFQNMHLGGYVTFPRSLILPAEENGTIYGTGKLATSFQAFVDHDWNFTTSLNFTPNDNLGNNRATNYFQFVGLDDFIFSLNDVKLDFSEVSNVPGINFPQGYDADDTWKGISVNDASLRLPKYLKKDNNALTVSLQNLIIDNNGLSVSTNVDNLLPRVNNGEIGGWGFSMEEFELEIRENEFENSTMAGDLKLPISETWIEYSASYGEDAYEFTLSPSDELNVDIWKAKIIVDESSEFGITINDGQPEILAKINGSLSFDDEIEGVDGINLKGLNFNDLRLENKAPYISGFTFNLGPNLNTSFAGFKVGIDAIGLDPNVVNNGGVIKMPLNMTLNMGFGDSEENGFSAISKVSITAKKGVNALDWSFDEFKIRRIRINGEVSSVSLKGYLDFYKNDPVFGNGYGGVIQAKYFDEYKVDAKVIFGHKNTNGDDYDYWFVAGNTKFSPSVPFVGPTGLNGFGGGAYYHMSSQNPISIANIGEEVEPTFIPDDGNAWGFLASVCFVNILDEDLFNGDVTLGVDFNNGGGLNEISLVGDVNLMQSPSITDTPSNGEVEPDRIKLRGTILYDHPNKILSGSLGYKISTPLFSTNKLNTPVCEFQFGGINDWYIHLGKPNYQGTFDDMISMGFEKSFKVLGTRVGVNFLLAGYYDMGYNMPPFPPLPADIQSKFGPVRFAPNVSAGRGVAFGLHGRIDVPEVSDYIPFYILPDFDYSFSADAKMGMDLFLTKTDNALCNGSTNYGMNGYYTRAQAYVSGDAHIEADLIDSINIGITVAANIEMPNPTFFKAKMRFVIGWRGINVKIKPKIKFGTRCDIEEVDGGDFDISGMQGFIANLELVDEMTPNMDIQDPIELNDAFYVDVDYNYPVDRIFDIEFGDITMLYRLESTILVEEKIGNRYVAVDYGQGVKTDLGITDKSYNLMFDIGQNRILKQDTEYRVTETVTFNFKTPNLGWNVVPMFVDMQIGQNIEESYTFKFKTQKVAEKITTIRSQTIKPNQNYFHKGDYNGGSISYPNYGIFDRYDVGGGVVVRFTNMEDGSKWNTPGIVNTERNYEEITFALEGLQSSQVYKMEIMGIKNSDPLNPIIVYKCYFGTSMYDRLEDKMDALTISYTEHGNHISNKYYDINFAGSEPFEEIENILEFAPEFVYSQGNTGLWWNYRSQIEIWCNMFNINISNIPDELVVNPGYNFQPPLDTIQIIQGNLPDGDDAIFANINTGGGMNLNFNFGQNLPDFIVLKLKYQPDIRINNLRAALFVYAFINRDEDPELWNWVQQNQPPMMPKVGQRSFKLLFNGGHDWRNYSINF